MVMVMSTCSSSRRTMCGCSVLTFVCTRQVGAAIPATRSDAVFTSTHQSKSSNLGKETGRELKVIMHIWHSEKIGLFTLIFEYLCLPVWPGMREALTQ